MEENRWPSVASHPLKIGADSSITVWTSSLCDLSTKPVSVGVGFVLTEFEPGLGYPNGGIRCDSSEYLRLRDIDQSVSGFTAILRAVQFVAVNWSWSWPEGRRLCRSPWPVRVHYDSEFVIDELTRRSRSKRKRKEMTAMSPMEQVVTHILELSRCFIDLQFVCSPTLGRAHEVARHALQKKSCWYSEYAYAATPEIINRAPCLTEI